jgi:hypothetical protein
MKIGDPARRAVDPDRLLPNEDPTTADADDARHWIRVYEELYRFKTDLIEQSRERLAAMPPAAQEQIEEVDLAIMLRERERLHGRLEFWRERLRAAKVSR